MWFMRCVSLDLVAYKIAALTRLYTNVSRYAHLIEMDCRVL